MTEQTGIIYEENESFEGETSYSPDMVLPNAIDPGTEIVLPEPEPVAAYHEYTLDLADTAMVYQPGSLIDTGMVLQYIVDRGYEAISVQAQLNDAGLPTGLLTVRTPVLAPDITVDISKADVESSSTPGSVVYVPATNLEEIPAGYTYSGDLTFAAYMRLDALGDEIILEPVVDGAPQTPVALPGQLTFTPISSFVTVSGLAAGVRSVGLNFVVDASGAETFIQDAIITGTLTSDQPRGQEITPGDWAEYTGARAQGIVETMVTWTDTAEGAITPKPDLDRLIAFWMYLEGHGYEVYQIVGGWNFATPEQAPSSPELRVYARSAVDPAVSDAFLYSEIQQADRDAFRTDWSAPEVLSRLTRLVSGEIAVEQYEYSTPVTHIDATDPVALGLDVRESDLWNPSGGTYYRRIDNEWVLQESSGGLGPSNRMALGRNATNTGSNSIAIGPNSAKAGPNGVAIGTFAEANGYASFALGTNVQADGERSQVIGFASSVPADSDRSQVFGTNFDAPADTPDVTYVTANKLKVTRSNGTGATTLELNSPDNTASVLRIENDGSLTVDGEVSGGTPAFPMAAGFRYSTIDRGYGSKLDGSYNTTAMVANRTYFTPIYIPHTQAFDRIGVYVASTAAGSSVRLGIFTMNPATNEMTLVHDCGTVSGASTTLQEATITKTLTAGWYWLGIISNGTPGLYTTKPAFGFQVNASFTLVASRISTTSTYGAFPSTMATNAESSDTWAISLRGA